MEDWLMPQPSVEVKKKLDDDLKTVKTLFTNLYLLDDAERKQLYEAAIRVHNTVQAWVQPWDDYR